VGDLIYYYGEIYWDGMRWDGWDLLDREKEMR
jgi:hypothetical protein